MQSQKVTKEKDHAKSKDVKHQHRIDQNVEMKDESNIKVDISDKAPKNKHKVEKSSHNQQNSKAQDPPKKTSKREEERKKKEDVPLKIRKIPGKEEVKKSGKDETQLVQGTLSPQKITKESNEQQIKPKDPNPEKKALSQFIPLEKRIKDEALDEGRVKFSGIKDENSHNQCCQLCFQYVFYPMNKEEDSQKDTPKIRDAKLLYNLVYCSDCFMPAHWNCLGENYELKKFSQGTKKYLIFKCDRCKLKMIDSACFICEKKQGLMKVVQSSSEDKNLAFYHQICAMSFPEKFSLVNPQVMAFSISKVEKPNTINKKEKCSLCSESTGMMLKCCAQDCDMIAHPYCIMNYLKDYLYESNYNQSTLDADEKYSTRWNYLITGQPPSGKPSIITYCYQHMNGFLKYCFCETAPKGNEMIWCEYCQTWYHLECTGISNEEKEEIDKYACQRCLFWKNHIQSPILDIVLERKTPEDLVKSEKSWTLTYQNNDYLLTEQKYFEQILMAKAWFRLSKIMLNKSLPISLIGIHIEESDNIIINQSKMKQDIQNRIEVCNHEIVDTIQKFGIHELKDLISDNGQFQEQFITENKRTLEQAKNAIQQLSENNIIITEEFQSLQDLQSKHEHLLKAANILKEKARKPLTVDVQALLKEMKKLQMDSYHSFVLLNEMVQEWEQWEQNQLKIFRVYRNDEDQLKQKLQNAKNTKNGLKLQEARYKILKEYLSSKVSTHEVQKILNQSNDLKLDVSEELRHLTEIVKIVQTIDKECLKTQQAQLHKKPVETIFDNLKTAAVLPIKGDKIDSILEDWYASSKWNVRAKQFLNNKLEQSTSFAQEKYVNQKNTQMDSEEEKMDIDEGNDSIKRQYVYTVDSAKALYSQIREFGNTYADAVLLSRVKEKIDLIEKLKNQLDMILQEKHDIRLLKDYLKEYKEHQTVDFSREIKKIEEKLKLVTDCKNALEYKQRVKIAQVLKKEFYDVLNKYQDTFNKNMTSELTIILERAEHQHNLDLMKEKAIVENIPSSEEWFLATYEKLKKIVGKSLHQVDFKDYIRLSTVLQDEKDCNNLLKTQQKPSDQLVGAAYNLWRSLSGVRWLFELKRLIHISNTQEKDEIELNKVIDLDSRAKSLDIDYDKEIRRNSQFSPYFVEFKKVNESINEFELKFGNFQKLIKTLETNQDKLEEFKEECEKLTQVLQYHKVVSQSGELDLLTKIHTYIEFLHHHKQLTSEHPHKLPYQKAMILSQLSKEKQIPEELSILKQLKESVARFEKFNREYSDYKRFRERLKKAKTTNQIASGDARFTCSFIRKLIEESKKLQIESDEPEDFDEKMLESDLILYDEWRQKAEEYIDRIEDDETLLNDEEERAQFFELREQMSSLPVYDKQLFLKIQIFEWLFASIDLLEGKESLSVGQWDSKIKQADTFPNVIGDITNHPVYQRMIWEVDQAKQVIEFCNTQKTIQKSLAAKFNHDNKQNYQFLKNKFQKNKLLKILEQAKLCKIEVEEEIRCLDQWTKDYDKFNKMYQDGSLFKEFHYDKLRDIAKQMYLSPLDYSDIYFHIKEKIEKAEMIRYDIKKILSEYENQSQFKIGNEVIKKKKLKYSKIQLDLKLYHKECNIKGIKEIDQIIEKVRISRQKLNDINLLLDSIGNEGEQSKNQLQDARKLYQDIEIDMEGEEIEIRRKMFEIGMQLMLNSLQQQKKMNIEEFKTYDKEFERIKNSLKNEVISAKFADIKSKVTDFIRRINKVENKDSLEQLKKQIDSECPYIDFSQMLIDKDAQILLGKRVSRQESQKQEESSSSGEESKVKITKRQKLSNYQSVSRKSSQNSKNVEESESSSEDEGSSSSGEEGSSSSGSEGSSSSDEDGSSSGSGSSSENSDDENSGSNEESSEEESKKINIAKNRERRKIQPNLNSDFIYENPSVIAQQKIALKQQQEAQETDEQKELRLKKEKAERKKQKKIDKKKKKERKRKERQKKRELEAQYNAHKKQQQYQQQTGKKGIQSRFENERQFSLGDQIFQDQGLQSTLMKIKNKIREQSRTKINEVLEAAETYFSKLPKEQIKSMVLELEGEIYKKHPEADSFYKKKVVDTIENIKFLKDFKDVCDLVVIKKTLQLAKLTGTHHSFKQTAIELDKRVKERRQQIRDYNKAIQIKRQQLQNEKVIKEDEVEIPKEQSLLKAVYGGSQEGQKDINTDIKPPIKLQDDSDDLESLDSGNAVFSDDEDQLKNRTSSGIQSIYEQSNSQGPYQNKPAQQAPYTQTPGQGYDIYQIGREYGDNRYGQQYQMAPPIKMSYNPYEILEQLRYSRIIQKKSNEPILYDPSKNIKKGNINRERNIAPPGSLLKVWEGILELAKDSQISAQFLSNIDINVFQSLPELPQNLQLKGKAKISDVTQHFLRLKREKRLIKGWICRKNTNYQDNNDKYTKMFDELDSTSKSALYNVFQGVTLYIIPITNKTKDFCKQMGIDPSILSLSNANNESDSQKENQNANVDQLLSEETHAFAVLSQIKQSFTNKINFLNPDVIKVIEPAQRRTDGKQDDMSYSPITSDEDESNLKHHKQHVLSKVKTEDLTSQSQQYPQQQQQIQPLLGYGNMPHQQSNQQDLSKIVKQDQQDTYMRNEDSQFQQQVIVKKLEEDENDVDIDQLIMGFKNNEYDLQTLQEKLMTIINKVKGEKEAKLTMFLQELINDMNANRGGMPPSQPPMGMMNQPPQIKQEPLMTPQNPLMNQNYQSNIPYSGLPQQQMNQFRGSLPPYQQSQAPVIPQQQQRTGYQSQNSGQFNQQQPFRGGNQQQFQQNNQYINRNQISQQPIPQSSQVYNQIPTGGPQNQALFNPNQYNQRQQFGGMNQPQPNVMFQGGAPAIPPQIMSQIPQVRPPPGQQLLSTIPQQQQQQQQQRSGHQNQQQYGMYQKR